MDEKLTFTGGEPDINFDDLDRNNKANRKALTEALRAYGDNYKIAGVISAAAPSSVTAGYVMLDGEILQVDAHTATGNYFEKVTTFDPAGDKTFNDTTPRQTWAKHRATQTSAGITNLGYSSPRFGDVIATLLRATASAAASTTQSGIQENATAAEAQAGSSAALTVTPNALLSITGGVLTKVVDIGDWNISTTAQKTVAHGLNYKKIRGVDIVIRSDSDTVYNHMNVLYELYANHLSSSTIMLERKSTSPLVSASYVSTGFNRGWLLISYVL